MTEHIFCPSDIGHAPQGPRVLVLVSWPGKAFWCENQFQTRCSNESADVTFERQKAVRMNLFCFIVIDATDCLSITKYAELVILFSLDKVLCYQGTCMSYECILNNKQAVPLYTHPSQNWLLLHPSRQSWLCLLCLRISLSVDYF